MMMEATAWCGKWRKKKGHGGDRSHPGSNAYESSDQNADEAIKKVQGLKKQPQSQKQLIDKIHNFSA